MSESAIGAASSAEIIPAAEYVVKAVVCCGPHFIVANDVVAAAVDQRNRLWPIRMSCFPAVGTPTRILDQIVLNDEMTGALFSVNAAVVAAGIAEGVASALASPAGNMTRFNNNMIMPFFINMPWMPAFTSSSPATIT